jgi:drug/metabolite transporter (DMT)-like permease
MKNKNLMYPTVLALAAAFISGTANFIGKIAVTAVKDPILFTGIKNAVVAILLVGLFIAFKKGTEIKSLSRAQWTKLSLIGIVGGSVPFALYFTGLSMTSAINASLIHKTMFLWVLLLAYPLLKERLSKMQLLGVTAIFASNLFIGGFTGFKFNAGELMIVAATLFWAVENIVAKKALADISALTVVSARMVLGSAILFVFLATQGRVAPIMSVSPIAWGWTLLMSALLMGYVLAWFTALKHAPATYVAALLVSATVVTNVLSAVFITHAFTAQQFASVALCAVGTFLMVFYAKKTVGSADVEKATV